MEVDDEPLLVVFDGLCDELGLEYEVRYEVIHIRQRKRMRHTRRVYDVADLVVPIAEPTSSEAASKPK